MKGIGGFLALIESSYGVSEIKEQTHILQRKVELTTVLTNLTFEVLDILRRRLRRRCIAHFF
ncbi:MAG: hypothetical protein IPP17_25095 [Bacteroidetes bacterium]|nr:hypothetical protein [Bacteroidota bacterium]